MKTWMTLMLLVCLLVPAFTDENIFFKEGSDLYRHAKYSEARVKFEAALVHDSTDPRIYLYLGVTYQQLKQFVKAIEILQRGLQVASGREKSLILFQLGNCYDEKGLADYALAEKYFTLAIEADNTFSEPYLNRAAVRLKAKRYQETIEDCKKYLKLWPETPKRKKVEELIALLQQDMADKQKLLDSIMNSLRNASTDTKTDAAGITGFKETQKEDEDSLD
jgi:tetratricopeptide (TPR) repeat protein